MNITRRTEPRFDFVWLASQSPRRQQLLAQLGVRFEMLLPDEGEDVESLETVGPDETPADYVHRVTRAKLRAARARLLRRAKQRLDGIPVAPILCADTTVALGRAILGKPGDEDEARRMLNALSGRTHRVLTSVAVHDGRHPAHAMQVTQVSRVRVAELPPAVIEAYIASGEPFGKAGAYAIQGALAGWIEHIEGSHSGIMGLPLHETALLLRRAGVRQAL